MTRVTLRLPDDLHRALSEASKRRRTSLNQFIVRILNGALEHGEEPDGSEGSLGEQVRHARTALGSLSVELDTSKLPEHLKPAADLPDREAYMRSLPQLSPPLSTTIIDEREDRA